MIFCEHWIVVEGINAMVLPIHNLVVEFLEMILLIDNSTSTGTPPEAQYSTRHAL